MDRIAIKENINKSNVTPMTLEFFYNSSIIIFFFVFRSCFLLIPFFISFFSLFFVDFHYLPFTFFLFTILLTTLFLTLSLTLSLSLSLSHHLHSICLSNIQFLHCLRILLSLSFCDNFIKFQFVDLGQNEKLLPR